MTEIAFGLAALASAAALVALGWYATHLLGMFDD